MKRFVFTFRSSSSPGKTYETIKCVEQGRYKEVLIISCNCPGWTRRVQPDGDRMCVHTRVIQSGDPRKDPLFISCVPAIDIPYSTQDYMRVENMGAENFAPLIVRKKATYFSKDEIPRSFAPYFVRAGRCASCRNFHFPEYENCPAAWNKGPQCPEPAITPESRKRLEFELENLLKIRKSPKPQPSLPLKPQRRKFNFDE